MVLTKHVPAQGMVILCEFHVLVPVEDKAHVPGAVQELHFLLQRYERIARQDLKTVKYRHA